MLSIYPQMDLALPPPFARPKSKLTHIKPMRRLFTPEEDALLAQIVAHQEFTTWICVAAQMLGRTARQCRDRWTNYLCPVNKNSPWTRTEDALLIQKFAELGPHWATIAKFFDGRSENNVKNRWYTHVKARSEGISIRPADAAHGTTAAGLTDDLTDQTSVAAGRVLFPPISTIDPHPPWESPERSSCTLGLNLL
jgi:hypothetical protein